MHRLRKNGSGDAVSQEQRIDARAVVSEVPWEHGGIRRYKLAPHSWPTRSISLPHHHLGHIVIRVTIFSLLNASNYVGSLATQGLALATNAPVSPLHFPLSLRVKPLSTPILRGPNASPRLTPFHGDKPSSPSPFPFVRGAPGRLRILYEAWGFGGVGCNRGEYGRSATVCMLRDSSSLAHPRMKRCYRSRSRHPSLYLRVKPLSTLILRRAAALVP
ncbi:hypothetical protein LXA43DRAFT_99442 [Ganoderma leucocontextum]|nr:hypothetical protein LXA43DRAFT_99442 [Ganoderma leucocontextum]